MANIEDYNNRLIKLHKIRPQYNFKTRRKTPAKRSRKAKAPVKAKAKVKAPVKANAKVKAPAKAKAKAKTRVKRSRKAKAKTRVKRSRKAKAPVKAKAKAKPKAKAVPQVRKLPRVIFDYKNPTLGATKPREITASERGVMNQLQKMATVDGSKPFFLSVRDKQQLQNIIYKIIGKDHYQCFNEHYGNNLANKIGIDKYISEGSFGRVFIGCFPLAAKSKHLRKQNCADDSLKIAVKTSAVLPFNVKQAKTNMLNYSDQTWAEVVIMNNLINPMIRSTYTPHLPYLYNWYFCESCEPLYEKKMGCVILLTELAHSDMYNFYTKSLLGGAKKQFTLNGTNFSGDAMFLLTSLFQIMNGLNALQQYPQVVHSDIKAQNMLVHTIEMKPNQYIHYNIDGQDYWLPNTGNVAMLADFGTCAVRNPYVPFVQKDSELMQHPHTVRQTIPRSYRKNLDVRPGVIIGPNKRQNPPKHLC